jgi:dTDP-4-dehydrorhamnose reductase
MRIVLFGGNGQLGWELQRALAPLGEVVAPAADDPLHAADFRAPERLAQTLRALRPAVVVNAAAYTAVDRAESEADLAHTINAAAPAVLAREAAALGAWLVHYSSDYVYDGSGSRARREEDPTGPLNAYGRSKLAGDQAVLASGCRHLVLRTSWVYAARGANFVRTMLRLAAERDALRVVDDQFGAPTGAELLADLTAQLLPAVQRRPELGGLYHACAGGETSWHGYARHLIARARALGHPVRVGDDAIAGVPSRDYPTPAPRPLNSRLATDRLQAAFGLVLPPWQQGVDRVLAELLGR